MFRTMRRFKQQISPEECAAILESEKRGVLALQGDDDYPYALPINFVYDRASNVIYFHCAKSGYKIDALKRNPKASFCTYDRGFKKEGDWAYNVKSVIVFGTMRFIEDEDEAIERVRQLGIKYYPTPEEVEIEIERDKHRVQMLALQIEHMTGKLVNES